MLRVQYAGINVVYFAFALSASGKGWWPIHSARETGRWRSMPFSFALGFYPQFYHLPLYIFVFSSQNNLSHCLICTISKRTLCFTLSFYLYVLVLVKTDYRIAMAFVIRKNALERQVKSQAFCAFSLMKFSTFLFDFLLLLLCQFVSAKIKFLFIKCGWSVH